MKISERKTETLLRLGKGDSALYFGEMHGEWVAGVLTSTQGENISRIDAALRGVAFLLSTDETFAEDMSAIYREAMKLLPRKAAND